MNILVTGANGQLGRELRLVAPGGGNRFIFSDVTSLRGEETLYLDITNPDAVSLVFDSEKIDLVINCAAYTDVEKAETDQAMADLLNHVAPRILATECVKRRITLIHISTDYVFSGRLAMPAREDWPPEPLGAYGATKFLGEQAIRESGCESIIIRTSWMFSPFGKNFVKTMAELTRGRQSLSVVSDQIGSPTYARDLARFISDIIRHGELDKVGTYHYTNEGVCSWYDFACAIRDAIGNTCDIRPCLSSEYPSKVTRPMSSVLDKSLVKSTFGITIPHWHDALLDCIKRKEWK